MPIKRIQQKAAIKTKLSEGFLKFKQIKKAFTSLMLNALSQIEQKDSIIDSTLKQMQSIS